ncbi:MAG: ATPase, T2SS/T4P/T4SS family [Myxococcota bacterium]
MMDVSDDPLLESMLDAALAQRAAAVYLCDGVASIRVDGRIEAFAALTGAQIDAVIGGIQKRVGVTDLPWARPFSHPHVQVLAYGAPTARGPRLTLRLRPLNRRPRRLSTLPLAPEARPAVDAILHGLRGLILVVGPTGSGITETLYALLDHVRSPDRAILTMEDPIEYSIPGVSQVRHPRGGVAPFVQSARGLLRQDPDVVMVDEIRARDEANVVVQCGLASGPLTLAGMRAPSAPAAIRTFLEIGVEPIGLADALRGVIAQRLVRRLCDCAVPSPGVVGRAPVGCPACGHRGYRGRVGVLDWLPMTSALHEQIVNGEIQAACGLRRRGEALVAEGATAQAEIERFLPSV